MLKKDFHLDLNSFPLLFNSDYYSRYHVKNKAIALKDNNIMPLCKKAKHRAAKHTFTIKLIHSLN